MICTYFGGHWPLVCPDTSISKRGRVRSGHDVIYRFLTPLEICCGRCKEKWQLFFGDKIPDLKAFFWKLGWIPVLRSLIRILVASLVQIDTEMTKKYSNQRYAVDAVSTNTHMSNTAIQIFVRNRVFWLPHLHSTPPLGGSRRNIGTPFGMEKREWCGYPMVKKISKISLFVLTQLTNVTDRQTDRHRMLTWAALTHRIARQKLDFFRSWQKRK